MAKLNYSMVGVADDIVLKGFKWTAENATKNLIIVTGMEEYAGRYNDFAEYLNQLGYNVYSLDHYGQGQTAETLDKLGKTIKGAYGYAVENIHKLAETLKTENGLPTYVMGHSMGSFIVQNYIQKYSNDVVKAIIMGSSGPNSKTLYKLGALLAKIKVNDKNWNLPGTFFANLSFNGYKKSYPEAEFAWLSVNKENVEEFTKSFWCGYGSSYGFYYELLNGNAKMYVKKNLKQIRKDLPILVIAGDADPVGQFGKGPKALHHMYEKLGIEHSTLLLYPGMRHEILNEDIKEDVYRDISGFLEA